MSDIILDNVDIGYPQKEVFSSFSLTIEDKKILAVLGNSGCGKSTLMNAISGVLGYSGNATGIPNSISYIFQNQALLPNLTVYGNLDYAIKHIIKDKAQRANIIIGTLVEVGLVDSKDKYPHQLSIGMAQRVNMARAFIFPSELVIMDEPFRGLDIGTKSRLMKYFLRLWNKSKRTVIFVTHTIEEALELSDRIIVLGNSPTTILADETISIPQEEREQGSLVFAELRQSLFKQFIE